ncbi:glutathione S-transferase, amine-terminal domain protein (macronuclear) [Tetrahymena thermophila SB210]|uniref:Glutathione S-transferase, amine-terminal domain protein n=1 Tax=Tetrahymena thermophila (strain SB210) TaxID=312017 RepID=Q24HX2_TETTS|nr:glutathione S-transferase, amine-terminal domain protein [Tetrahymena thermophila SB210]EAS07466.1 glutathione S-transferase, amine-terminal domain protein [Tetrahymena thermophila SB210]|eukprot:XP_001027708.1 glutathione S-transferase, amine-terminal domain protein [Tetrahymena thermophila SB210]
MSQPHLKLYGNILCPYVQRVRFALEALKLQYDYVEIDLLAKKHLQEEYLAINPLGCVPTININNSNVYESLVLLEFLEEQFGNVFPKDTIKRAQQRIWANYYDQNVIGNIWDVFQVYKSKDEEGLKKLANKLAEEIRYWVKQTKLSERVKANPKTFYEGEQLTYVDFAVVPHTRYLEDIVRVTFNKQLFDLVENDDLIKDFRTYINNVTSSEAYNRITHKLPSLPAHGENSLLDSLNFTPETYDYSKLVRAYLSKRFES